MGKTQAKEARLTCRDGKLTILISDQPTLHNRVEADPRPLIVDSRLAEAPAAGAA